jgi:hypothetical protein
MAEWSNAAVLKTVVRATEPGVRIPLSPLIKKGWNFTSLFYLLTAIAIEDFNSCIRSFISVR